MTIKPIETRWNGYRFRSRLEARWAVFFDALGLSWEYEPEGFDLSEAGRYLPDFRVATPQGGFCWYEVKPRGVTADPKVAAFAKEFPWPEFAEWGDPRQPEFALIGILSGDPIDMRVTSYTCPRCGFIAKPNYEYSPFGFDGREFMFGCYFCDARGGDHEYEAGLLGVAVRSHKGWVVSPASELTGLWRKIGKAARAAREARFEFGEAPKPSRASAVS